MVSGRKNRVWVPKKSGFPQVLGGFGFPTTSLLMGLGTKNVGVFPGFPVSEPITNPGYYFI